MYGALDKMGVDMTKVKIFEGAASDPASVHKIIETGTTDRVVYVGPDEADSEYCNQIHSICDASVKVGAKQLIVMSATGTSRPWSLKAIMANSTNLKLGWQRRGEDTVRASGIDYTIIKAGLVSKTSKAGKLGLILRQGDVFGTAGTAKPGLHPTAAAAICSASTMMKGRRVTLEVVGKSDQPPCTDMDYDWGAAFGVLMDDDRWAPPDLDTLVAHDRAVLCCSILFVVVPILVCFVVWLGLCVWHGDTIRPGAGSHENFSALVIVIVGLASSFSMLCYWRKTLFRGCCCCIPLDYSTTGRRRISYPTEPGSTPLLHSPASDSDSDAGIQAC